MNRILIWTCAAALTVALRLAKAQRAPPTPSAALSLSKDRTFATVWNVPSPDRATPPVRISAPALKGAVNFRPAGSNAAWTTLEMVREADNLVAWLPHQPIAQKLEYRVMLRGAAGIVWLKPVTIRFRGFVPPAILLPHILAMFLGFLFAARAGLAVANHQEPRPFALAALVLLGFGGLILGPIVQKIGLGDYWTGWPFGPDLTDNKTLVAWLFWLPPLFSRRGRWVMLGAVVTFLVFAIPHSVLSGNVARYSLPLRGLPFPETMRSLSKPP